MIANTLGTNDLLEFGPFRLDLRGRRLSKGSETLALAPKSFDVLAYLVRHAGRAVSREELLAAVGPDVVVSDGSLTQAVFVVRRALGEREDAPGFVATVPRVGYRFSEDVRTISRPEVPSAAPPLPAAVPASEAYAETDRVARRVPRGAIALVLLLFAAAVVAVRWTRRSRRREPAETSPGLLALVREIAAPPDATALLGAVRLTAVLAAPSARYLLPLDGAQAATRLPLAAGEVVANRGGPGRKALRRRHDVPSRARRDGPHGRRAFPPRGGRPSRVFLR